MRRDEDRDDAVYVHDMLRHAREVVEITRGRTVESLRGDRLLQLAVERLIEIVGEAARNVSEDSRRQHPDVPWERIARQRHVIAHDYGDIDYDKIWGVVTVHVPALITQLARIVPPPPPDPDPEDA